MLGACCGILAESSSPTKQAHLEHQAINGDYQSDDETEKHLLGAHSKVKQRTIPSRLASISSHHDREPPASNLVDINAMSVASIYDQENNDIMDADM